MIKKLILLALNILTIILFFSCANENVQNSNSMLVVGSNANYPPYESYNQDGQIEGFDIDLANAIADKLGVELTIKNIDFDSLIIALKQGKVNIIMSGMSITSTRGKEITMVPYQGEEVKQLTVAFWKEIPPHIKSLKDMDTVAVQVGTYQEVYLNKIEGIKVKALDGTPDLILELQYGKSPAVLFEPHIADVLKAKFSEIQLLPIKLPKEDWVLGNGIGIKKDNHELIKKITEAINELKKEGVVHKLERKWFGEEKNVI